MHSRIYELKESPDEENELNEFSFESEELSYYGIDYVDPITKDGPFEESIKWLAECYKEGMTVDVENRCIRFDDIPKMLTPNMETFKKIALRLAEVTPEEFAGQAKLDENPVLGVPDDISYAMYLLNAAYSDKSAFYIYHRGVLRTINDFLRESDVEKDGVDFYFGTILDYHF